jgi:hypothetical protein
MTGDELTECAGCHKVTPTIQGRCPNCWYEKNARVIPRARRYRPDWWDLDSFDLWDPFLWSWIPVPLGVVLVLLGVVAGSPVLLILGGCMLVLRLTGIFLPWDLW